MRKLFHCAFALAFAASFAVSFAACSDDDNGGPDPNTEWEITMTVDLPKADTVKVHTLIQWDEVPLEDWETPLIYWNGSGQPGETLPRHYYEAGRHTFSIRGKGRVIVECPGNHLVSIDARECPVLYSLSCRDNDLTEILLGEQRELRYVWCDSNRLTSLDFSSCLQLRLLRCSHNELSALDLTRNSYLEELECNSNPLESISLGTLFNFRTFEMTDNLLSDEEINRIFSDLPTKTEKEPGSITIDRGRGDLSILEKKHWDVHYFKDEPLSSDPSN